MEAAPARIAKPREALNLPPDSRIASGNASLVRAKSGQCNRNRDHVRYCPYIRQDASGSLPSRKGWSLVCVGHWRSSRRLVSSYLWTGLYEQPRSLFKRSREGQRVGR